MSKTLSNAPNHVGLSAEIEIAPGGSGGLNRTILNGDVLYNPITVEWLVFYNEFEGAPIEWGRYTQVRRVSSSRGPARSSVPPPS